MARLLNVDGTEREVSPENGAAFTLVELQRLVGGYVQIVTLFDGRLLLFDEEGKMKGLPKNELATALLDLSGGAAGDCVVGPALVTDDSEVE